MSIFSFRFLFRRAPKGRRSFQPELDRVEPRILLDAGVITSLARTPVVGGQFELQAVQANGLPYPPGAIQSVTWTIQGALSGATLNSSGYHPQPLGTVTTTGDTITAYWDGSSGAHSVVATIQYTQPTWMGIPIATQWPSQIVSAVNVQAPTVTTSTQFGTTALSGSTLTTFNAYTLTPGFSTRFQVNPGADNAFAGQYGVVQVDNPSLSYYKVVNGWATRWDGFVNPNGQASGPLLDKISTSDYPYYSGTATVGGSDLMVTDSPRSGFGPTNYRMNVQDNFTDTVMYTPTGGIPVPVATASWTWGGVVSRDSSGQAVISSKINPGFVPGPTGQTGWTTTTQTSGIPFPQWNGKVSDYIQNGTISLTQVPLAGVIPLPDPYLALNDPWDFDPYNTDPGYPYDVLYGYGYDPYPSRDPYPIG